jgi:hypothetical protein
MIKHFDGKELTHLRYLADAIAIKPMDADKFVGITLSVVKPSLESDPSFIGYLTKLKDDLKKGGDNDSDSVRLLADKYAASKDDAIRRMGEILLWGLNHKRPPSRKKGRGRG